MADIAGAVKAVRREIYDNWSLGPSLASALASQDLSEAPTKDVPYFPAFTVAQSDTQTPVALSVSVHELQNNLVHHSTVKISDAQMLQLLDGNGSAVRQALRAQLGAVQADFDLRFVTTMLANAASTGASAHTNLATAALTKSMVYGFIGRANSGGGGLGPMSPKIMLANPEMGGAIRTVFDNGFDNERGEQFASVGLPFIGRVGSVAIFEHQAVPGGDGSYAISGAITASSIEDTADTMTLTLSAAQAAQFVVGQQVYTSGLTTDVDQASPATIQSISGGTVVLDYANSGDVADNGTSGTLYSASAMAIIAPLERIFWSAETPLPRAKLVETSAADGVGTEQQVIWHTGHVIADDTCRVLHAPLS